MQAPPARSLAAGTLTRGGYVARRRATGRRLRQQLERGRRHGAVWWLGRCGLLRAEPPLPGWTLRGECSTCSRVGVVSSAAQSGRRGRQEGGAAGGGSWVCSAAGLCGVGHTAADSAHPHLQTLSGARAHLPALQVSPHNRRGGPRIAIHATDTGTTLETFSCPAVCRLCSHGPRPTRALHPGITLGAPAPPRSQAAAAGHAPGCIRRDHC
jgi:hypothetical protein